MLVNRKKIRIELGERMKKVRNLLRIRNKKTWPAGRGIKFEKGFYGVIYAFGLVAPAKDNELLPGQNQDRGVLLQ
jgi:hypothetical protein